MAKDPNSPTRHRSASMRKRTPGLSASSTQPKLTTCSTPQIGMEMWARFAHKELWHDYEPGWALHKSHHEPRTGPFEANDIYAVMNAVPAMGLCLYGFFTPNMAGGLAFGAGLGITLFGIMYMFFHDGLVHR
jgi:beta-carotene 3-hydroxylase